MNLDALTAKATIKLMTPYVSSGNIALTKNGTLRKLRSSEKLELTQFAQL